MGPALTVRFFSGDSVACHDLVAQSDVAPYMSYANVTHPVLMCIASGPRAAQNRLELDTVEFGDFGLHVYAMYSSVGVVDWAGLRRRAQSFASCVDVRVKSSLYSSRWGSLQCC